VSFEPLSDIFYHFLVCVDKVEKAKTLGVRTSQAYKAAREYPPRRIPYPIARIRLFPRNTIARLNMPVKALNVLVFTGKIFSSSAILANERATGTGTSGESVKHCIATLRRLLYPNYAVIPIEDGTLLKEPWTLGCALFVMPGGADLGYCRVLNGAGNNLIQNYIRLGGRYLGFCAGGYYASERCEFEVGDKKLEVIGRRELAFFPGICRGAAFKGFHYHSEQGARAASLSINRAAFQTPDDVPTSISSYFNGGGVFVNAAGMHDRDVEVLATYDDPIDLSADSGHAAVICRRVGDGIVMLTGPHPEYVELRDSYEHS
jgi:glutamine amidotransferase-like uncharacterized protein